MAVASFTVLLIGFILGGSTVYLVENHLRTNEMNKIYKLTESLINGNELDGSDIGKETIYSKTTNQLIRLQEILEGRRKEAEKSKYEIQKLISEIAHQLRTPLANIKNYTELLQESLNETQETLNTEYIKDLRTSEEQLCFLVESFIKTARLEQGIIQVHTQKENLVETILNALGQEHLLNLLKNNEFDMISVFNNKYKDYLKLYYYIGGMPEVVNSYVEEKDLAEVRNIQKTLLKDYEQDFSKHAPNNIVPRIRQLWNNIPTQLAKENKKFI